jgi:UDP-N-acetylglucosamine diphosphorylase / glucose-1-phosphate thymidylyltransferase / UDP-N-acetylgalactosamine diphosphorylase / glucosamine-1-phosphate N-acetyltransferase / galactosamine-1-phosphate N-acetyltransferase
MRICIFEDQGWSALAPLSLTRPVCELRCGASTLWQRQVAHFTAKDVGVQIRPMLAELCRLNHPDWQINALDSSSQTTTVLVNARWLPLNAPVADWTQPQVGLAGEQVAYAVLPVPKSNTHLPATFNDELFLEWKHNLPRHEAGGSMMDHPWDLVEHNAAAIRADHAARRATETARAGGAVILGSEELAWLAPSARVEPLAVLDTQNGPILIEPDAVVQSFSRIEGPCVIGVGSTIYGARVSGSAIGPGCKIGGEVEAAIVHGFTNKAHEGFLGHSYLGEWVNLGAGTQFSDLRNDYQPVRIRSDGVSVDTGRLKIGSFVGDFTRTGLNTLFNTGSIVGAFCNLPSAASYLPRQVPSFSTMRHGQLQEETDLNSLLKTASAMMKRRGRELTATHVALFRELFEFTQGHRNELLRR